MPASRPICADFPRRWIIVLACFLGFLGTSNVQTCLSIAITQMVVPRNHTIALNNDTPSGIIDVRSYQNESSARGKTFDWDEKTQGQILSSFFWGYMITCILAGSILNILGGKRTVSLCILSTALLTLMVPKSVEWGGARSLTAVRFLTGLGHGAMIPATIRLISRWIPAEERSRATAWAFAGSACGTIVGMAASGAIIQRSDAGWPTIFYAYGAFGVVVFCIQCAICHDSPAEHPCISKAEIDLLRNKLKHSHADLPPVPWRHVVRSKPIWAIFVALIGNSWCTITLASDTPKFMSSVLKFNVETNGFVSAIPYVCSWTFSCAASWFADRLITKRVVSIACVRKVGNSVAMLGAGLFLVAATYAGRDRTLVVALYVLAKMMLSCMNFSATGNTLDLAPNYAGTIEGVVCGVSLIVSVLSPYVAGFLTPNQTIDEWRMVFWLIFAIGALTNVVFVVFGEAQVQKWNDPPYLKRKKLGKSDDVEENFMLASKNMQRNEIA